MYVVFYVIMDAGKMIGNDAEAMPELDKGNGQISHRLYRLLGQNPRTRQHSHMCSYVFSPGDGHALRLWHTDGEMRYCCLFASMVMFHAVF